MRFGDYLAIEPDLIRDEALESWMSARDTESLNRQFFNPDSAAQRQALMMAPIPVVAGAPAAAQRFPLVLHSLGRNGNQFQHTILWEYLASHGYVVASVAQFGSGLDDPTMAFSVRDLRYQQNDMALALRALRQLPYVDANRIGALGHSSGAIVALWLASSEPSVAAVVGLDGSVNRGENHRVFRDGLDGRSISAPFLNVCRWPHDEYDDGFAERLSGPVLRVGFARAIHFDFQNWPAYQAFANATEPSSMAVRSVDESRGVFVSTARVTRLFLESHLRSDPEAAAILGSPSRVAELSQGLATLSIESDGR